MSIIYIAINTINNKTYVGKTKYSLKEREKQHLQKVSYVDTVFYRAIKRYGAINFKWTVIHEIKESEEKKNI